MAKRPDNDLPRPERAEPEELRDWETIQENQGDKTQRLMLKDGWLYRTVGTSGQVGLVFVPGAHEE